MSKSTWFTNNEIQTEHKDLPVRQIYVWFITSDNMLAIVGRNNKFQFPGGKPEKDETVMQTIERELFEEAGIKVNEYDVEPKFFGYYLVEEDVNASWDGSPYLQLRYYLKVSASSKDIDLSVNERIDDADQVEEAKFVPLGELDKFIPWIEGLDEYEIVRMYELRKGEK